MGERIEHRVQIRKFRLAERDLLGQFHTRGLAFIVLFIEALCVGGGRQARVQFDHAGSERPVRAAVRIVGQFRAGLTARDQMKIRRNQIGLLFTVVSFVTFREFGFLKGQLFADARVGGGQKTQNVRGALTDVLFAVARSEIGVEQRPRGFKRMRLVPRILRQRQKRIFHGLSAVGHEAGREPFLADDFRDLEESFSQRVFSARSDRGVGFPRRPIDDFPCHCRRNAEKSRRDPFVGGSVGRSRPEQFVEFCFVGRRRVGLVLHGRKFVGHARKHLSA